VRRGARRGGGDDGKRQAVGGEVRRPDFKAAPQPELFQIEAARAVELLKQQP
jgi:hypothetical protein